MYDETHHKSYGLGLTAVTEVCKIILSFSEYKLENMAPTTGTRYSDNYF